MQPFNQFSSPAFDVFSAGHFDDQNIPLQRPNGLSAAWRNSLAEKLEGIRQRSTAAQEQQAGQTALLERLQDNGGWGSPGDVVPDDSIVQSPEFHQNRQQAQDIRDYTGGLNADHARVTDGQYSQLPAHMQQRVNVTGDSLVPHGQHRPGIIDAETVLAIGNNMASGQHPWQPNIGDNGATFNPNRIGDEEVSYDAQGRPYFGPGPNGPAPDAEVDRLIAEAFGQKLHEQMEQYGYGPGKIPLPDARTTARPGMDVSTEDALKQLVHRDARHQAEERSSASLRDRNQGVHRNALARANERRGMSANDAFFRANQETGGIRANEVLADLASTPEEKQAALEYLEDPRGRRRGDNIGQNQMTPAQNFVGRMAVDGGDIEGAIETAQRLRLPGWELLAGDYNGPAPTGPTGEVRATPQSADSLFQGQQVKSVADVMALDPGRVNISAIRGGRPAIQKYLVNTFGADGAKKFDTWLDQTEVPDSVTPKELARLNKWRAALGLKPPAKHKGGLQQREERQSDKFWGDVSDGMAIGGM